MYHLSLLSLYQILRQPRLGKLRNHLKSSLRKLMKSMRQSRPQQKLSSKKSRHPGNPQQTNKSNYLQQKLLLCQLNRQVLQKPRPRFLGKLLITLSLSLRNQKLKKSQVHLLKLHKHKKKSLGKHLPRVKELTLCLKKRQLFLVKQYLQQKLKLLLLGKQAKKLRSSLRPKKLKRN